MGFLDGSDGKESSCNAGDMGSIPGLGRSPGGGHGIQSSILAWIIPMDRGPWHATVRRVAKSQTQLKKFSMHRRAVNTLFAPLTLFHSTEKKHPHLVLLFPGHDKEH